MTQHGDMSSLPGQEMFRAVLEVLSTGVVLLDRQRKILFWNEGAERITGYHRHEAVGHTSAANILARCNDVSCVHCGDSCPLRQALYDGRPAETQGYLHHKAGHSIPVHLRVNPIRDEHGSVIAIAGSFDEELWGTEPEIRETNLAAHGCLDVTTGVPNHAFTQSHLRENLAFFQEYHLPFGILCIQVEELDHLKATHGREASDVMLHVIAQTMKHTLRPDGFLGRWGEEQFLAIVTNCEGIELERAAQNVLRMASSSGIHWWDDVLSVMVSTGRAMAEPGDTLESLLERVYASLESAKSAAASSDQSRSAAES